MAKNNLIIIFGIIIALLPFLGFPQKIKTVLFVLVGLLISFIAYRIGRQVTANGNKQNYFKNNSDIDHLSN